MQQCKASKPVQHVRNEKGGALIIVLFILTLFTVLGYAIANYTMQSAKQHVFSEDEIQGKMLADMGLTYFQKYIEHSLDFTKLKSKIHDPDNNSAEIITELNKISSSNSSPGDITTFKKTMLPAASTGGPQQGFAIGYQVLNTIYFNDDQINPSQPYSLKLKVSVIGLPARDSKGGNSLSRVRLDSVVYINTIPAPFHYAVSTPGELRLFGGSNLIGNVTAHNIVVSKEYRFRDNQSVTEDATGKVFKTDSSTINTPYLEGNVLLSSPATSPTNTGIIYSVNQIYAPAEEMDAPNSNSFVPEKPTAGNIISKRSDLRSSFIPVTLEDANESKLSAPADQPYLPGYEAPVVENSVNTARPLFLNNSTTVSSLVKQAITAPPANTLAANADEANAVHFEDEIDGNDGFFPRLTISDTDSSILISQTYQTTTSSEDFLPLTARLTGDNFKPAHKLMIGPSVVAGNYQPTDTAKATVEMGRKGSFSTEASLRNDGEPFTFTGTIYIKGNLDIVGDIKVNGTIYVDGDVLIREISNIGNNNLAIIASGTISMTSRYANVTIPNASVLSAFLYSEKSMEIYSVNSANRIEGGIATGGSTGSTTSYIEFDTKRENSGQNYASHLTIQFNRRIYEQPTPGLPAGEEFFVDIYDQTYGKPGNNVTIQ